MNDATHRINRTRSPNADSNEASGCHPNFTRKLLNGARDTVNKSRRPADLARNQPAHAKNTSIGMDKADFDIRPAEIHSDRPT